MLACLAGDDLGGGAAPSVEATKRVGPRQSVGFLEGNGESDARRPHASNAAQSALGGLGLRGGALAEQRSERIVRERFLTAGALPVGCPGSLRGRTIAAGTRRGAFGLCCALRGGAASAVFFGARRHGAAPRAERDAPAAEV